MAPALGPEGTSLSGPRHLLLFLLLLLLLRRRRRGPGGSHSQDLALLPDTLTPRPSQEGARACTAPDLGAINHACPGCAQRQHLARGSRLGQPEGRGEQEARGRGAPGQGCGHRPFSSPQVAPAVGNSEPGPGAGEALGPRCAAPEQFATWRWPRDHLSSALGAPAGLALGAFSSPRHPRRPRPARTTGARPTRTPGLRTVGLRRRLVLRLPVRRAPFPAAGGPGSPSLPHEEDAPLQGRAGGAQGLRDSRRWRLGNRGAPGGRDRN